MSTLSEKRKAFLTALVKDNVDNMIYAMHIHKITSDYEFDEKDLLFNAMEYEAYNCASYLLKTIKLKRCHMDFIIENDLKKMINALINAGISSIKAVKFLNIALENDAEEIFFKFIQKYNFDYERDGSSLVIEACGTSWHICNNILKFLFKNGTPMNRDYIYAGLNQKLRWLPGFEYLLDLNYNLKAYVPKGKTVYTQVHDCVMYDVNSDATDAYYILFKHGYDFMERETIPDFRAGYDVIPPNCENYFWDIILKRAPCEAVAEKFIILNNAAKMQYLFNKGLKLSCRVGKNSIPMYEFAVNLSFYKSAMVIFQNDNSFNPRVFRNGKFFMENLLKKDELEFIKVLCEKGIGFSASDFKDRRLERCKNSFYYAYVSKADVTRIFSSRETHIPTLIYSILATEDQDAAKKGVYTLELLSPTSRTDLAPFDDEYRFVLMAMRSSADAILSPDVIKILLSHGANINYQDIAFLMSNKNSNAIKVLQYLKEKGINLSETDSRFNYIEKAVKSNQLSGFIELLYEMGAKISNTDFDLTFAIKNYSYDTVNNFLDLIIRHDINLSNFDGEKKYFSTLLTTEKNETLTVALLQKLKDAGASPKSIPLSMLLKGEENINQEAIKDILKFFIKCKSDVSEDDKENYLLDIIFQYNNVRYRNIEVMKMVIKLGANPSNYTKNVLLLRLIANRVFAPEYYSVLLKAGADPNATNIHDETALTRIMKIWGKSKKRREVIKVLVKYGANGNIKDTNGYSAIKIAKLTHDSLALIYMKR